MTAGLALDALTVDCPTCGAEAKYQCWYQPNARCLPRSRDPHPARIEAARALLLSQPQRLESAWLELATIWRDASEDDRRAILAVVKLRQAMPAGTDELVAVLEHGAEKHNGGDLGIAAGVTVDECADHLMGHAVNVLAWPAGVDAETRRLDAAHAAARGVMVAELVRGGK